MPALHPDWIDDIKNRCSTRYKSQTELANEAKVDRSTVNKFLNGKSVNADNFQELCDRLSLKPCERYTRPKNEPEPQAKKPSKRQSIPHNLPPGVARDRFFGQDDALRDLHDRLGKSDRVAVTSMQGLGGVGKSELAVQYARQFLAESYRGGVVWLSGDRAGLELIDFARSQFFPDRDLSQLGFVWSHWPADEVPPESVLLVFDDVTNYREQVAALLPSDKRFKAIVTTRHTFQGIDYLDLAVLKPLAALRMLTRIVGRDRLAAEARTARDLLKRLGYLPLAIELVGYLASKPDLSLAKLAERLEGKRIEARALNPEQFPEGLTAERGVLAAFELSWEVLSEAAQELAMRLSFLRRLRFRGRRWRDVMARWMRRILRTGGMGSWRGCTGWIGWQRGAIGCIRWCGSFLG